MIELTGVGTFHSELPLSVFGFSSAIHGNIGSSGASIGSGQWLCSNCIIESGKIILSGNSSATTGMFVVGFTIPFVGI